MGKLIDADALIFDLKTSFVPQSMDYTNAVGIALRWLREAPEAVVRCKDCVHWYDEENVCLKIYSDGAVHQNCWQKRDPYDFCSYGKRRDAE